MRRVDIARGRCCCAQLASGAGLELAHALVRDSRADTDCFQGLRGLAVESEAKREHAAHARVQMRQRIRELLRAQPGRPALIRRLRVDVLDQIAVHALAVADECLEARGSVCWYTRGAR